MVMRVSVGIHMEDIDGAIETYNLMSEKWFTHASPTLFNSGTPKPQLSSCFLLTMKGDSIEGIYDTLKQCAVISKNAGGVGLNVHCIRSLGTYIAGTNGESNGISKSFEAFTARLTMPAVLYSYYFASNIKVCYGTIDMTMDFINVPLCSQIVQNKPCSTPNFEHRSLVDVIENSIHLNWAS